MKLIEIRHQRTSVYVRADAITSVEFPAVKGEAARVITRDGPYPCTNPGAVRDAWQAAMTPPRATPGKEPSIFRAIFGDFFD